jgi:hypothetical protein
VDPISGSTKRGLEVSVKAAEIALLRQRENSEPNRPITPIERKQISEDALASVAYVVRSRGLVQILPMGPSGYQGQGLAGKICPAGEVKPFIFPGARNKDDGENGNQ